MASDPTLLDQLYFYTLAHPDPRFIHQHVVDAYAAQQADEHSKPIGVALALIGLYLHLEKGYTGRQVQLAHMQLAKKRKQWPRFPLPHPAVPHPSPKSGERVGHTSEPKAKVSQATRGDVTVADVMAAPAGPERDRAIERWCASVWKAWSASHDEVARLVASELSAHS